MSIIQHHMPLYLLSSNMDQCLALTSAVTALPAVSVPTDDDDDEDGDDGDWRSGLAVNPVQRRDFQRRTETRDNNSETFGWGHRNAPLSHLAPETMLRGGPALGRGGPRRSGRGGPRFGTAPASAPAAGAI